MIEFTVQVALLGNGLTAGIMLAAAIGIVPLTLVLPYGQYVRTIQFLWPRYDPLMPIAHIATIAADALLVLIAPAPARLLFGAAGLALVAVMVISVVKNVPMNRYVMSLDPDHPPPDWARQDPRPIWRAWNLRRTALAVLALVLNAAAASL